MAWALGLATSIKGGQTATLKLKATNVTSDCQCRLATRIHQGYPCTNMVPDQTGLRFGPVSPKNGGGPCPGEGVWVPACEANFLLAASIKGSGEVKRPDGLLTGHAYSVLEVQEVHSVRLVRLRNPWGKAGHGHPQCLPPPFSGHMFVKTSLKRNRATPKSKVENPLRNMFNSRNPPLRNSANVQKEGIAAS